MQHLDIIQNTDDWWAARLGRITSSKFDVLYMAENTKGYKEYVRKIAYERTFNEPWPQRFNGNDATIAGHEREQLGIEAYENRTFQKVKPGGFFEYDEWIGGSPDGLVGSDGLVEIKNIISGNVFMDLVSNDFKPSREHLNQCHGQMYVSGRSWVDLVHIHVMSSGRQIVNIQRIERDQEVMGNMEYRLYGLMDNIKAEMSKLEKYT